MSLAHQVEIYLGRKVDFLSEVKLKNDGDGDYIAEWNALEDEPTQEQLNALQEAGDNAEALNVINKEREALIQAKMRAMAEAELVKEGLLTA